MSLGRSRSIGHDDGEVLHGEVSLDGEAIGLHHVSPDHGLRGAAELGAATGMLNVRVHDVDAHTHARSPQGNGQLPANRHALRSTQVRSDRHPRRLWSFATPHLTPAPECEAASRRMGRILLGEDAPERVRQRMRLIGGRVSMARTSKTRGTGEVR